ALVTGVGNTSTLALLGGNFTKTVTLVARTMTTDFAVLARNVSGKSGDYIKMFRTPCATATNVNVPFAQKYADEDYGYIMYNRKFYTTKNFDHPAFGIGTNYEFMVAPRVEYYLQASQILPQGVVADTDLVTVPDTQCTRTPYVFTNTSSK